MRPFPWTSSSWKGCGAPNSYSLEPETSALPWLPTPPPAPVRARRESGAAPLLPELHGQGDSVPEAGTGNAPGTVHVGGQHLPAPQLPAAVPLPRAASRGSSRDPAAERPQPFSPHSSFLGSSCFPGTETHTALYSHLVCPARPFPSRTHTQSSAWNPEQSPHLPPGQSLPRNTCLVLSAPNSPTASLGRVKGKQLQGCHFPAPGTILEHAWLLKHKVFFAFLSLGCLRRGWRESRACPTLAWFLCKVCTELSRAVLQAWRDELQVWL